MSKLTSRIFTFTMIFSMFLCFCFFFVLFILPKKYSRFMLAKWAKFVLWQLKVFCGIKYEMRGLEHKKSGGVIFASKHQSAMETLVLGGEIEAGLFALKKSLMSVPVFGWFLNKSGMIALDRSKGIKAMYSLIEQSKKVLDNDIPFVIFPEGTRKKVDEACDYKAGIYMIYKNCNVPVVPMALNTGLFWVPEKGKHKGTAVFEYLPAIEPGLPKKEFMQRLETSIETATDALVTEGRLQLAG